jgi:hypothetical protein
VKIWSQPYTRIMWKFYATCTIISFASYSSDIGLVTSRNMFHYMMALYKKNCDSRSLSICETVLPESCTKPTNLSYKKGEETKSIITATTSLFSYTEIVAMDPKASHSPPLIHLIVCLTTGPKPFPALHIVRSRASYFN